MKKLLTSTIIAGSLMTGVAHSQVMNGEMTPASTTGYYHLKGDAYTVTGQCWTRTNTDTGSGTVSERVIQFSLAPLAGSDPYTRPAPIPVVFPENENCDISSHVAARFNAQFGQPGAPRWIATEMAAQSQADAYNNGRVNIVVNDFRLAVTQGRYENTQAGFTAYRGASSFDYHNRIWTAASTQLGLPAFVPVGEVTKLDTNAQGTLYRISVDGNNWQTRTLARITQESDRANFLTQTATAIANSRRGTSATTRTNIRNSFDRFFSAELASVQRAAPDTIPAWPTTWTTIQADLNAPQNQEMITQTRSRTATINGDRDANLNTLLRVTTEGTVTIAADNAGTVTATNTRTTANPNWRTVADRTDSAGVEHATVGLRDAAQVILDEAADDAANQAWADQFDGIGYDAVNDLYTWNGGTYGTRQSVTNAAQADAYEGITYDSGIFYVTELGASHAGFATLGDARSALMALPDTVSQWSSWSIPSGPENEPMATRTRTRTVTIRGAEDNPPRATSETQTVANPDFVPVADRTFRDVEYATVALRNQAEEAALAPDVAGEWSEWTEVAGTRNEATVNRTKGEVTIPESKSKYVHPTRVDTIETGTVTATFERTREVTINGDDDGLATRETESRVVAQASTRTETVTLSAVINPAWLAARQAFENHVNDQLESGYTLTTGVMNTEAGEIKLNINHHIGQLEVETKHTASKETATHTLSAHAAPRFGLIGVGQGWLGRTHGLEVGASVQNKDSDTKFTVGYDTGTKYDYKGASHNGFKRLDGNGRTDDSAFVEIETKANENNSIVVRANTDNKASVTIKKDNGVSFGVNQDGRIQAGYTIKF